VLLCCGVKPTGPGSLTPLCLASASISHEASFGVVVDLLNFELVIYKPIIIIIKRARTPLIPWSLLLCLSQLPQPQPPHSLHHHHHLLPLSLPSFLLPFPRPRAAGAATVGIKLSHRTFEEPCPPAPKPHAAGPPHRPQQKSRPTFRGDISKFKAPSLDPRLPWLSSRPHRAHRENEPGQAQHVGEC